MCGREIKVRKNANKKFQQLLTRTHAFIQAEPTKDFLMGYKENKVEKVSTLRKLTFLSVETDKNQENK